MQKQRVRLLAAAMLSVVAIAGSLAGTAALAQPHGARPSKPAAGKPKPAGSAGENPSEDRPAAPAAAPSGTAAAAPASASVDAGPVAAPAAEGAAGARLSPLNPAPSEFSDAGAPASTIDYDRLLADIAALRARVAAVSDTMFHSRIAVSIETSGDATRVAGLSVSLDDGMVWTSPASFRAEDGTTIYDHAVAPGNHAVTVDIERRDRASDAFRATQRSRFVVDVPADQRLTLEVRLWDDSNMGEFPKDKQGRYELRVRARAKAEPIGR
jgi:hypothetical protein